MRRIQRTLCVLGVFALVGIAGGTLAVAAEPNSKGATARPAVLSQPAGKKSPAPTRFADLNPRVKSQIIPIHLWRRRPYYAGYPGVYVGVRAYPNYVYAPYVVAPPAYVYRPYVYGYYPYAVRPVAPVYAAPPVVHGAYYW